MKVVHAAPVLHCAQCGYALVANMLTMFDRASWGRSDPPMVEYVCLTSVPNVCQNYGKRVAYRLRTEELDVIPEPFERG